MPTNTATVNVSMPKKMRTKLDELAKKEDRSVSYLIRDMLNDFLGKVSHTHSLNSEVCETRRASRNSNDLT